MTLINGAGAIILSRWYEDDSTPGYGVQTYYGATTGIHEAFIAGLKGEASGHE
ncbi:MAG: hypothetical protein ACXWPI_16290 [Ktedonobacterales bacterium]